MASSQYSALPTSLETSSEEKLEQLLTVPRQRRTTFDRFLFLATISTILVTLFSCGIVLSDRFYAVPVRKALRRPNPFPNPEWLREIAKIHNRTFTPIVNIAPLSFQMKVGDRKRGLVEDVSRERDTIQGRVWPDDRKFLVTNETSTVMQFRTRDFDMERCVLTFTIPTDTKTLVASAHANPGSRVDVWMLDNSLEIHPAIFWGTAPARKHLLTTFEVSDDLYKRLESAPFRCQATSFSTLEFACADRSPSCYVEFWQDREKPHAGVYIMQHHASPTDVI